MKKYLCDKLCFAFVGICTVFAVPNLHGQDQPSIEVEQKQGVPVDTSLLVDPSAITHKDKEIARAARIDGYGPDWKQLGKEDFTRANCDEATWEWDNATVHCTGHPVGVLRSTKSYKNFEFVAMWRHLTSGGNSGFFVWTPMSALQDLPPGHLPNSGIEVQVLDHGYTEKYEKSSGKKADWFRTDGDVFAVGKSKMNPFPPKSPDGSRSFPRERHSKGFPEWNHYYVRAINGEVRLWVNGHEVSGGSDCSPAEGYLCLESEGAPVEFNDIRIRELK